MIRNWFSVVFIPLLLLLAGDAVFAEQPACAGPSQEIYLECAKSCQTNFRFTENTEPSFAQLQSSCIDGCGQIQDAMLSKYEGCYTGCKELFRFRHGMNPHFADFQNSCIKGCRHVQ